MTKSMKIVRVLMSLSLLSLAALPAQAADLRFSSGRQGVLSVASTDIVKNLYAAGSQVIVNASPSKDLVAAGGSVDVNGNVADDLLAAGGNVNVKGNVGGSARIAGGTIHVDSKTITDDLVVAGGTVYVGPDTTVNGDLIVTGGNVFVQGTINGNIKASAVSLTIDGKVGGNIDAKLSQYLELDSNADIRGNINYAASTEVFRDSNAKVAGQITFTQVKTGQFKALAGILTLAFLIKLVGELIAAFVLYALFKKHFTDRLHDFRHTNFWANLGLGFLALVVTPILGVILLFTFVGYYLAFALLFWYLLMVMLAWIIAASFFGSWLISKVNREEFKVTYWTITVGVVLSAIIKVIPLIGILFFVIMMLAGFGVILRQFKREIKSN